MKSTRILIKTPFKMRCPAAICSDLRGVNSSLCIGHFCTKNAKLSKILQDVYSKRSRNGVKSGRGYYHGFKSYLLVHLFYPLQHTHYFLSKSTPHNAHLQTLYFPYDEFRFLCKYYLAPYHVLLPLLPHF